jgi:hypothetical protein
MTVRWRGTLRAERMVSKTKLCMILRRKVQISSPETAAVKRPVGRSFLYFFLPRSGPHHLVPHISRVAVKRTNPRARSCVAGTRGSRPIVFERRMGMVKVLGALLKPRHWILSCLTHQLTEIICTVCIFTPLNIIFSIILYCVWIHWGALGNNWCFYLIFKGNW